MQPPFNMVPIPLSDEPLAQTHVAGSNDEVLMGLFIGQLPRSLTVARIRNMLIALSNSLSFPLKIYHVDVHIRSGSCAFATVNHSAALIIAKLDKHFAIDSTHLWLARTETQRAHLSAFLFYHPSVVPKKPIVVELRGPNQSSQNLPERQAMFQLPTSQSVATNPKPQVLYVVASATPPLANLHLTCDLGTCVYQLSEVPGDCMLRCASCGVQVNGTALICPTCLDTKCHSCK